MTDKCRSIRKIASLVKKYDGMLVLVGAVKMADRVVREMMGL